MLATELLGYNFRLSLKLFLEQIFKHVSKDVRCLCPRQYSYASDRKIYEIIHLISYCVSNSTYEMITYFWDLGYTLRTFLIKKSFNFPEISFGNFPKIQLSIRLKSTLLLPVPFWKSPLGPLVSVIVEALPFATIPLFRLCIHVTGFTILHLILLHCNRLSTSWDF